MIADRERIHGYVQALRRAVVPGAVVIDLGTGTGIFAMLACQFGAHRVYAIEPSDAIHLAREFAADNGYAQRIEFVQELSTRVTLPERADVVISDLRGVLPPFTHHIPSIVDARERLLAPGGVLIPRCDTLWAAVVEAPGLYERYSAPWDYNTYGLNLRRATQLVRNTWSKKKLQADQLLVKPQCWATLDYTRITNADVVGSLVWTVTRPGSAHGLCLWFDAEVADGIGLSNAPGEPELIYGNAFFPWSRPVSLSEGDTVFVKLRANLVGDDYIWSWDTRVLDQAHAAKIKADFKQSTFYGVPLSPARLRKGASGHIPALNEDGQIDRHVLAAMDGKTQLEDIARSLFARWPLYFSNMNDALTRVSDLSKKYSQ